MNTTPVTIGLIGLVFAVVFVAVGIVMWLVHRFDAIEKRFDTQVDAIKENLIKTIDQRWNGTHGELQKIRDSLNLSVLAASEQRNWVLENFMSRTTADAVNARIFTGIENLQNNMEARFVRLDARFDQERRPKSG